MKTYKKVVERPMLVISQDLKTESPRRTDTVLGEIVCAAFHDALNTTRSWRDIVIYSYQDGDTEEERIELIKTTFLEELGEEVLGVFPMSKCEDSLISYSLDTNRGLNCSKNCFYIVTKNTMQKNIPIFNEDMVKEIVKQELKILNLWLKGEAYKFTLYNNNGDLEKTLGGIYNIEHVKELLPKGWEKEEMLDYYLDS